MPTSESYMDAASGFICVWRPPPPRTFAKHSQRVLSQQPAAKLLYQLHYVPAKPATFSFAELQRGLPSTSSRFTGEDVFKQQAERRATLLLGQSLIITGQIYCELCPADELPSWLPLEDF